MGMHTLRHRWSIRRRRITAHRHTIRRLLTTARRSCTDRRSLITGRTTTTVTTHTAVGKRADSVARYEGLVAVRGRKLRAGIKAHPERSDMRTELLRRCREFVARVLLAEFGVRNGPGVTIRVAEIQSRLCGMIQRVGR